MPDAPLMLSVSGCRGIVGESLTPDVAARFAGAFAAWLRERSANRARPRVVLARDGRSGGHATHHAAIAGLTGSGCDVLDAGVAMTPTVGVAVDQTQAAGGMVVTASHNGQEWNGLKCLVRDGSGAAAPAAAAAEEIIARFRAGGGSGATWRDIGEVRTLDDATGIHVDRIHAALAGLRGRASDAPLEEIGAGLRVVVDSVEGAGGPGARELLESLGCEEILHLGGDAGGVFPHTPEPTRENLTELCAAVRESGAHVGFAQDPDADRLAIVDERGEYIGEEYTWVLAAMALLGEDGRGGESAAGGAKGRRPAAASASARVLVTNLSTSRMIDDVAAVYGARVVRTKVGEANVVEAMRAEAGAGANVALGGEGNGGVIWPAVTWVRDSLSGMALVLDLMGRSGRTLSELAATVPAYAIEKRKVALRDRTAADRAADRLAAHWASQTPDRRDGVRVDFLSRRAWLHVRASNTEPIMRLIAEAPSAKEAAEILAEAERVIGG